jgi:hypothetical protein
LRSVAVAIALLASALYGCGGASGPTGTYTTYIPGPTGRHGNLVAGKWTVTFAKNGTYTITSGPEVALSVGRRSHYRGTTFVIATANPGPCGAPHGTGTYTLKLTGATLRFVRVKDPCQLRALILGFPYTKVR